MLTTCLRVLGLYGLATFLLATTAQAVEPVKETSQAFKLGVASQMDSDLQGQKQKIGTSLDLRYQWQRDGQEKSLAFRSLQLQVSVNGQESLSTFMSRAKFVRTEKGKTDEVKAENAPEPLRKLLQDSFDVPVCKLQVDQNGKEVKRTLLAGPGAKSLVDNNLIANALLFHPPFPQDKSEWEADSEVSMGEGGSAKGKLSYQKVASDKGVQLVKVSGKLMNDSFQRPGTPLTIKDSIYVVSGEQTYDLAQQEWVSGKLTMRVSFKMTMGEKLVGTATGTMIASLEKLRAK